MRGNVENKNNNPINIRFVGKTSDIINLSENITSDVMLIYQKWQVSNTSINDPELLVQSRGSRSRTAPLFRHKGADGGAEGAQAPLSDQNIDVYFLSLSPTLYCKSRSGALQNVLWQYHRRSNTFVVKPGGYEFSRFEKY